MLITKNLTFTINLKINTRFAVMSNNTPAVSASGGVQPQQEQSPVSRFMAVLPKYESNIASLLKSKGMSSEEFMIVTQNAIKKNPQLASCDSKSLFGAILTAAELGLPLNTPQGFAHLIPFNRSFKKQDGSWGKVLEVQFIIGYQGMREIALRNPNIIDIDSDVVYEGDLFEYEKTENGLTYTHKKTLTGTRGKRVAAYATARIKDGTGGVKTKTIIVYSHEIELVKKLSMGANSTSSPWSNEDKDPFGWMWRKTALKQLCKELPKLYPDPNIMNAVKVDSQTEMGAVIRANEDGSTTTVLNEAGINNIANNSVVEDTFAEEVDEETGEVMTEQQPATEAKSNGMVPDAMAFEAERQAEAVKKAETKTAKADHKAGQLPLK